MVGALWIDSGSDSDSDAAATAGHRQHSRNSRAVAGPSRLDAAPQLRKSPRRTARAPPSSSSSVIALSSSQDHDQHAVIAAATATTAAQQATPGQRMMQLLAEPSPDSSLPSLRDMLRQHTTRTHVAPSTNASRIGGDNGSLSIAAAGVSASRLPSASLRAGSLRRTASQPTASSSQEDPTSSLFRASVRRPTKRTATNTALPEVIEIGSDSIVDPASEADLAHTFQTSSPIRSQFSARNQLPSSQPVLFSPPPRFAAVQDRIQARGTARQAGRSTLRADSAPIVILSSSPPPPPSLPRTSQGSLANAIENIAQDDDYDLPHFPPSSFTFENPPPSPPFSPVEARPEAVDTSPSPKRRAVGTGSKPTTPKRAKPMARTTSLLEALDKLYVPEDDAMPKAKSSKTSARGSNAPAAADNANNAKTSTSKAQKAAAAKESREAKAREREAVKAAKAQAAAEKKRFLEVNRLRTSKTDTMRELIIDLDRTLFSAGQPFAGQQGSMQARFEEEGASVHLCDGVVAPPLVRFRRKVKAEWNTERRHWVPLDREEVQREAMVIVYVDAKEIVQLVGEGGEEGLESWYGDLKRRLAAMDGGTEGEPQVFLICQGLVKFYSRLRANENRAYTARIRQQLAENQPVASTAAADQATSTSSDAAGKPARRKGNTVANNAAEDAATPPAQAVVERSLLQLKLIQRCYVIHAASLVDGVEWVHQLTSDLSLKPYKSLRDTHLSFAVDTGRNTTSSSSAAIYATMLQQIPRVTPAIASSITTIYPSLHALVSAYQRCTDEGEQKAMLSGVQVQSNKDGTERRGNRMNLGLQLSKRVHAVVRGTNAELLINNPTKD
ncbi:conserved hypothetical protein [Sporisorium reilianum SRZ2]|uniref:ERCC4 domain-containing protein n=1 Tax=Sporisorium reilianum (strain SRZ2) TaxID=999809 RepID=E6ZYU4_SPORE|nr:conserved hypothetical protein [Sporisorium reilianum SRZ2]